MIEEVTFCLAVFVFPAGFLEGLIEGKGPALAGGYWHRKLWTWWQLVWCVSCPPGTQLIFKDDSLLMLKPRTKPMGVSLHWAE